MFKKTIPLLIICITAGLLAACSSTLPLLSDAESSIKAGNYDAALTAAKQAIQKNPKNALAYYYKGVALGQKGQSLEDASAAAEFYQKMSEAFAKAKELSASAPEVPEQIQNIGAVKTSIWRTEHNKGVEYATNDSLMQTVESPLKVAVSHMHNATVVQPDSALSWNVLAQLNNMQQNYEKAAAAQQTFMEKADSLQTKDYLLLAQYYRLGDQPQEAIDVLEKTRQQYPDSTKVIEILADSYSQVGQPDKAIAIVEELVQMNPDNPQYRLSLGTQIYQKALGIREEYDANINKIYDLRQKLSGAENPEAIQQQIAQIMQENAAIKQKVDALADRAIEHLKAGIESRPDDAVAYNTLGIIYQNKAAAMYDQRNLTLDNAKAASFDKKASDLLKKSLQYYEHAAQLDPDNQKYWRSLYQIYTQLGMDQKAVEAGKKAGIQ